MSEASWVRRLSEMHTSRQLFEAFCTVTEQGVKYMRPSDVMHALTLSPPFHELKVRFFGLFLRCCTHASRAA